MIRLLTIPISHYCEKVRWALDHLSIPFVEVPHLQVFHYRPARRWSGQGLVPVLDDGGHVLTDSTRINRYLSDRARNDAAQSTTPASPDPVQAGRRDSQHPLQPTTLHPPAIADEVTALDQRFSDGLGIESRRWMYHEFFSTPDADYGFMGFGTPWYQRAALPLVKRFGAHFIARHLGVTAEAVRAGDAVIDAAFLEVESRLSDGRPFLFGDTMTAADISFACMAAPLVVPATYGVPLPTLSDLPDHVRDRVEQFRSRAGGGFALRLFDELRRHPSAVNAS